MPGSSPTTVTQMMPLTAGTNTWPRDSGDVWITFRRGRNCIWIACAVTENAPVMADWLAITVAAVARTRSGHKPHPGASR